MSYTDDAVKAKLSALNETQDSIVTVAQWIMFHRYVDQLPVASVASSIRTVLTFHLLRRYADRTAQLWLTRIKDSGSNKRLNLIYLVNEVAQQSKARKKDDFLIAFSPMIPEASAIAYKGATHEVQSRLRRVFEVWRQRQIFEDPIQDAVEARINGMSHEQAVRFCGAKNIIDLDKERSSGKKALGGSLFSASSGPSAPSEIQPLVPLQIALSKAAAATANAVPPADADYTKITELKTALTPPVHAARLSSLLKVLASAENAVSESVKARRALLAGLDKIIETNKTALAEEEIKHAELSSRKAAIDAKKRDVEDTILKGLNSAESSPITPGIHGSDANTNGAMNRESMSVDPERPDIEELTPPPPDTRTPEEGPPAQAATEVEDEDDYEPPILTTNSFIQPLPAPLPTNSAGSDLLSSLTATPLGGYTGVPGAGSVPKKRKLDDDDPVLGGGGDAMVDLDEDVAELLRAESGGR